MGGWDLIITCPVTRSCCLVDLDNFYADYCKSHLQISHFLQIQMWREMSSYLSHTLAHDLIISLTRTQIPEIEMRELSFQSVQLNHCVSSLRWTVGHFSFSTWWICYFRVWMELTAALNSSVYHFGTSQTNSLELIENWPWHENRKIEKFLAWAK